VRRCSFMYGLEFGSYSDGFHIHTHPFLAWYNHQKDTSFETLQSSCAERSKWLFALNNLEEQ
jgi:hypothetical protein